MPRGQSIGEAFVTIRPDLSAFTRDLKNGVEQSGKSASDTLKTVITVGAFTVAAKEVIGAASDLQQAVGGTTAVFGESQAAVAEWAKGADEAAGLSERAARQLTSQIGGLLKGFGFAKDEAAATSIELAQIGADLAATFGGTTQEAVEALAAALRGETDPLERFGISLNQAAINAKAMELGLADSATEVTGNAKAQAALALITERSADAQGQFGREADTAAGQLERSKAKIENTAASIGSDLLPVVAQAAELVGFLTEGFAALPQPVQTAALALGAIAIVGPKVGEHLSSLASLSRSARDSLDTLALKAMYARDGLAGAGQAVSGFGSTLTLSNPILLASAAAITGLAAVWVKSQSDAAAAAAAAKDYTAAIEAQTGAVEANVDAAARKRFADNAVGKILADTSANFDIFTKGIQENEDALDAWAENAGGSKLTGGYKNFENSLRDAAKGGNELAAELIRLRDAREISSKDLADVVLQLEKESNAYDSGAEAAARNERVIGDTADTADRAASAAGELSTATDAAKAAFEREQQAAQDAADALDRVLQSTDDLFGAQLSAEEASLATKRALDAYRDSLKDGTKSADDRRQAGIDLLQAFQAEAEAAAAAAQKQADLTGQQFDAGDAAIVQRDKLAELAAFARPRLAAAPAVAGLHRPAAGGHRP